MTKKTKPLNHADFEKLMAEVYDEDNALVTEEDWEHVKRWPGYEKTYRIALENCAKGKSGGEAYSAAKAYDDLDQARKDGLQDDIADSWFVFVSMESVEARWRECPCYQPFARFVAKELLPWLSTQHQELRLVRKRTLIGLSYTGLAAAFVAKECPGIFQRVISQSGSFWWNDCWLSEQYRLSAGVPTDFYLDVGTKELAENVRHREDVLQVVSQIEGVRRFRDVLRLRGHSVRYVEFDEGHDFTGWQQTLPGALRWALPN